MAPKGVLRDHVKRDLPGPNPGLVRLLEVLKLVGQAGLGGLEEVRVVPSIRREQV